MPVAFLSLSQGLYWPLDLITAWQERPTVGRLTWHIGKSLCVPCGEPDSTNNPTVHTEWKV